jgi:hypothetical protein
MSETATDAPTAKLLKDIARLLAGGGSAARVSPGALRKRKTGPVPPIDRDDLGRRVAPSLHAIADHDRRRRAMRQWCRGGRSAPCGAARSARNSAPAATSGPALDGDSGSGSRAMAADRDGVSA